MYVCTKDQQAAAQMEKVEVKIRTIGKTFCFIQVCIPLRGSRIPSGMALSVQTA